MDANITLLVANPEADDQAIVYPGVNANIQITLTNNSGAEIGMNGGNAGSYFEIFMPYYYSPEEVAAMEIKYTANQGWKFTHNTADNSLILAYNYPGSGTWAKDERIVFTISGALTNANPQSDSIQINLNHFTGQDVPFMVTSALNLNAQKQPGNLSLNSTLSATLAHGGRIFVSDSENALLNNLYLTLRNTGTDPICSDEDTDNSQASVKVSFVYGGNSGSLAPSFANSGEDSAWNITGKVLVDESEGWEIQNPSPNDDNRTPVWTMRPSENNTSVLGTGYSAAVTFCFGNILSFTPPGATHMVLQFTGFRKDAQTAYDDEVLIVGIDKRKPPRQRGAISVWCPQNGLVLNDGDPASLPLAWSIFNVGKVRLSFYSPQIQIPDQEILYKNAHTALAYDHLSIDMDGLTQGSVLFVTLTAYDDPDDDIPLNNAQCMVPMTVPVVVKSFSIKTLPIPTGRSSAFRLSWSIQGSNDFEILEYTSPKKAGVPLNIPRNARSFDVYPREQETIYELLVFSNQMNQNNLNSMDTSKDSLIAAAKASVVALNPVPTGTVMAYAGSVSQVPEGWTICDGRSVSGSEYPDLVAVIGDTVPDLRSRFIVGAGEGDGLTEYEIGDTGGEETVALNVDQLPKHSHTINGGTFKLDTKGYKQNSSSHHPFSSSNGNNISGTDNTGNGSAHENRPPYFALCFIIKC